MGSDRRPAAALESVSKRYGETAAVADLSVTVEDGEFFTLVGPSGCGKTTTLRLLAGFEAPTTGRIELGGEDVAGVPPEDREVGVVFQEYALFPHMTVGENIGYGLSFADPPGGVSRDERIRELLALVDLEGTAERDPTALSGGQRQRVALARALAPGPELLLLDEPMSALDARLRERLRVQLREIQSELGITTVYVTHDQEEALAISDRVAVMQDGRIEQTGRPRELYRRPATQFVAEFLGENNLLSGRVTAIDGETVGVAVEPPEDAYEFAVAADRTVAVDDRVLFCVRPERLTVGAGETENELAATARNAEFLGATTRVHLEWRGRELLALADRAIEPGAAVTVGFEPEDAHLLPRE